MDSESSKPLINIGDLAKPIDTFIAKVSDAVGALYQPTHVRKMAKAEVDADRMRMLGRLELNEIEERAMRRVVVQEARSQKNIEGITQKAIEGLRDDAEPEKLDGDWVSTLFEECKHVSNPEMQNLWANILAGEANKSGTFSIRTVKLLGSIGKEEAELFTQLCGFAWLMGNLCPLVFDLNDKIYNEVGIHFTALNDLAALGLVSLDNFGISKTATQMPALAHYFGTPLLLDSDEQPVEIPVGHVSLTKSGQELATICGATPKDGFIEYAVQRWAKPRFAEKRIRVYSGWPRQGTA